MAVIATRNRREPDDQNQQDNKGNRTEGAHGEKTIDVGQRCGHVLHLPHSNLLHSSASCRAWSPAWFEAVPEWAQPAAAAAVSGPRQSTRYRSYGIHTPAAEPLRPFLH